MTTENKIKDLINLRGQYDGVHCAIYPSKKCIVNGRELLMLIIDSIDKVEAYSVDMNDENPYFSYLVDYTNEELEYIYDCFK